MQQRAGHRVKSHENKRVMCVHRRLAAVLLPLLFAITLPAQVRLTLEQAGARMAPDWTPVYEGKEVIVTGQVSSRPLWDSESYYLPIQDKESYGLMLESTEGQFHEF